MCTTIPLITHSPLKIHDQQWCYILSHYGAASHFSDMNFFFYISWSRKNTITVKKNKNSRTSSWAVLNRWGSDISGCYPLPRLIWQIVLQSVTKRLRQCYEGLEIEQSEWKQQTRCKEATAAVCFINSMCHCTSWDAWRGAANNNKIILETHHLLPPGRNGHHGHNFCGETIVVKAAVSFLSTGSFSPQLC